MEMGWRVNSSFFFWRDGKQETENKNSEQR